MSKGKQNTKTLKISLDVHKKLKLHIAEAGGSMTEFADSAILSKLVINTKKQTNGK